jgi:hypothetical protein
MEAAASRKRKRGRDAQLCVASGLLILKITKVYAVRFFPNSSRTITNSRTAPTIDMIQPAA